MDRATRSDIQGLRAVAVLLVVLGHAGIGFLAGGFVGVDVFFVLSGFLITGLLLSGAARERKVSFVDFYSRRARRILPAATLTLLLTDLVAYALLNPVRARQVLVDSEPTALFLANIHFANLGTDYFAQDQPPSPVQHFWSLAVEEQFYVVWPALLALLLFGFRAYKARQNGSAGLSDAARRRVFAAVILVAVASVAWSIRNTADHPDSAFFSTTARAWELALGAALTLVAPTVARLGSRTRAAMGCVGLIAIAAAAVLFSADTPFPGYAALLPTVGAVAVIGAGIGPQSPWNVGRLLAVRPMRYVGDRSYTLYLWHWPFLIIAEQYEGHKLSVGVNLLLILGAFALSIVTYKFFENPIRRRSWDPPAGALVLAPASVIVVFIISGAGTQAIDRDAIASEFRAAASAPAPTPLAPAPEPKQRDRKHASASAEDGALPAVVKAANAADRGAKIPSRLTNPVASLLTDRYVFPAGCAPDDGETSSPVCRLGDASSKRTIVVMGDSHAQMWMPAILSMAKTDGWVVRPLAKSACSPTAWLGVEGRDECRVWYKWAKAKAKALHPDVTLVTGAYSVISPSEATLDALNDAIVAMKPASKSVIVLRDTPRQRQQPVDCLLSRNTTMRRCSVPRRDEEVDSVGELAANQGGDFIDTSPWFCTETRCPTVIGNTIAFFDTGHLTKTYASQLAGPFRTAFRRARREGM